MSESIFVAANTEETRNQFASGGEAQAFVTITLRRPSYKRMASPLHCTVLRARFVLVIAVATVLPALLASAQAAAATNRVPVLVELFTSEGCSDCPPADALLERLDASQFVPSAQAIVLSEHVTYWNHEGWEDPFSFETIDERQKQYVLRFGLSDSYTPQAIVDGSAQVVGNNTGALTQAMAHAAETPKAEIAIENVHWENGAVDFAAHGPAGSNADLIVALAANATRSEVARGENAGRTLHHVAVVRVIKDFGSKAGDGRPLKLSGGSLDHGAEAKDPVRLVVFLADRKNGHVIAVAEQTLTR